MAEEQFKAPWSICKDVYSSCLKMGLNVQVQIESLKLDTENLRNFRFIKGSIILFTF